MSFEVTDIVNLDKKGERYEKTGNFTFSKII